jgi:hypothetical protein
MTSENTTHIILNATYKDGTDILKEHRTPARASIHTIDGAPKFRELNLRIVVEARHSEELLAGLCSGVTSVSIEQIPSAVERDSKT